MSALKHDSPDFETSVNKGHSMTSKFAIVLFNGRHWNSNK